MKVIEKQNDPLIPKVFRLTDIERIEVSTSLDLKIKFYCIRDRINNPDGDLCFIRCLLLELTDDGKDFTDRIALETPNFPKIDLALQLGIFLGHLGRVIGPAKVEEKNINNPE